MVLLLDEPNQLRMFRTTFTVFLLLLCLASCGPNYFADQRQELDDETWLYEQELTYPFEIQDTSANYTFFLDIKHSIDFPYQNFYTRIATTYPSGEAKEDIISIELADEFGLWEGKCNRSYCQIRIPLQAKALFQETGAYQIAFEQYTRVDSLPGLKEMALRVLKN